MGSADQRKQESLKSKFSKLSHIFTMRCEKLSRAKVSGAPCDEDGVPLLDPPTHENCTTHVFWKHKYQDRPAAIPPWSCNGGTAAQAIRKFKVAAMGE